MESTDSMPAESKKIALDQYNATVSTNMSSEAVELRVMIPCEDGAFADVNVKIESPIRAVSEDGSKSYSINVVTTKEVTNVDRVHTGGGQKRRSDGLYWEIPPDFPEAEVGLLEHESKVKEFMMSHFKENDTFVDVGANVGGYSVRAASWDMKVYAFEPNTHNLALLRRNIEINNASVNVLPFALGSRAGKASLSPIGGVSRIVKEDGVEVEKLTLEKYHPVIMIEMHYWAGAESEAELFEMLKALGYKLEYIDRYGKGMHLSALPSSPKGKGS